MAENEHDAVIRILKDHGGSMMLLELSQELSKGHCLGFGVETEDVVYALRWEGKVRWDYDFYDPNGKWTGKIYLVE